MTVAQPAEEVVAEAVVLLLRLAAWAIVPLVWLVFLLWVVL